MKDNDINARTTKKNSNSINGEKNKDKLWCMYASRKQTQQQIADDLGKSRWRVKTENYKLSAH